MTDPTVLDSTVPDPARDATGRRDPRDPPRHGGPDAALALFTEGYEFITRGCRATGSPVFATRIAGQSYLCMQGVEAARLFYDESRMQRAGAVPWPVRATLFGIGGVQGLDGAAHRHRRHLLRQHLTPGALDELASGFVAGLRARLGRGSDAVDLHRDAGRVLTTVVHRFCGIPLSVEATHRRFADLQLMVTGAAAVGAGRWRALRARHRVESQLADLVTMVRAGRHAAAPGTPLATTSAHRDLEGQLLPASTVAVELLNLLRPTVALNWYVSLLAITLDRFPDVLDRLRDDPSWRRPVVQEVRRHLPFFPFVAARTTHPFTWRELRFPGDVRVLLDLFGTNHDPAAHADPTRFDPERFVDRDIGAHELVPQGGGDEIGSHRCIGEQLTIQVLEGTAALLADEFDWRLATDRRLPRGRMPTLPPDGVVLDDVRPRHVRGRST